MSYDASYSRRRLLVANIVLDAMTSILPAEPKPNASLQGDSAEATSPVTAPTTTMDMLQYVLKRPRFQEEVRVNVCVLVGSIGRKGGVSEDRQAKLEGFKNTFKPLLEAEVGGERELKKLQAAANRALTMLA